MNTTPDDKEATRIAEENRQIRMRRKETGNPFYRGIISSYAAVRFAEDGRVDVKQTVREAVDLGVNCFSYLIMQRSEAELGALPEFCDEAARNNMEVWAYLVPPAEVPGNKKTGEKKYPPFGLDYVGWAEALAGISLQKSNLTMWMMDDFGLGRPFTVEYAKEYYDASKKINPDLLVGACVYEHEMHDIVKEGYAPYMDAVLWGYQDSYSRVPDCGVDSSSLSGQIAEYYRVFPDRPIIPCIYVWPHSSWPKGRPTEEYLKTAIRTAYEEAGIVFAFRPDPANDLLRGIAHDLRPPMWRVGA